MPDNLPRRAPFFGRHKDIDQVLRALGFDERGWGVVIDGVAGIGKTALAVESAYRAKELGLFDAFVFVSAKQKRLEPDGIKAETRVATTLDEFVNETARTLSKSSIAQLMGENKHRALIDVLRPMRTLLIYDNLETLSNEEQEALANWLRFLPQGCKAILTSRRRGGKGALWLRLEKLDWQTARAIIEHESEQEMRLAEKVIQAGELRWRALYEETGGSPLALIWTLGLMRVRRLSFDDALKLLRQGASQGSDLQKFIFEEASREVGPSDKVLLNALSLFAPSASSEALMVVANLMRPTLETALERLIALSLVDVMIHNERYCLHSLARTYIRDELLVDTETSRETEMRFARYWVDYARRYGGEEKESYKKYYRLEEEWTNLDVSAKWLWQKAALVNDKIGDVIAAQLMVDLGGVLSQFLWFAGRWDEGVQLGEWAYYLAEAMKDWRNAGRRAYDVVAIYNSRARIADTEAWTVKCAKAWEKGGSKHEQAVASRMLGEIAKQSKRYGEAERLYIQALKIWRELSDDREASTVLTSLSGLAHDRKDHAQAEQYGLEALELARKTDQKEEQATYSGNLGVLALERKHWSKAREWFEQELPLAKEVGRQSLIAQAQYGLACVFEGEGQIDLALPLAQDALEIYKRLQHKNLAEAKQLVERLSVNTKQRGE
jgi:hypothetical protein